MADYASFAGIPRVSAARQRSQQGLLPGSPERAALKARLAEMSGERIEIPLIIGGEEIRTGRLQQAVMPHDHAHVLADWHGAESEHVLRAIQAAHEARREWASWALARARGGLHPRRETAGHHVARDDQRRDDARQSKTVFQAEIDAASELVDFWRFNPYYAQQLYEEQPISPRACGTR
jgi:1-pyrroline-5-carboxylate dehydrogenase